MADYLEDVYGKLLSFLRYIEYDEDEKKLVQQVAGCEKVLVEKAKRQNGQESDSDDDLIDPQFKGENLPHLSFRNEQKVH